MKYALYFKKLTRDFVGLMFPKVCINCQTTLVHDENYLCVKCRLSLPKTNYHLVHENPLDLKFVYEPKFQKASSFLFFYKGGIAQKIIHQIKYGGQQDLGILMGELFGRELQEVNWPIDLIIPVPLHKTKLIRRGFNQSDLIAEGISRETGWAYSTELVIRRRRTSAQTKKSKVERWKNIQSVYTLTRSNELSGKTVAVVDDVLTTGATIGELITLLAQSGVKGIYVLTLAAGK